MNWFQYRCKFRLTKVVIDGLFSPSKNLLYTLPTWMMKFNEKGGKWLTIAGRGRRWGERFQKLIFKIIKVDLEGECVILMQCYSRTDAVENNTEILIHLSMKRYAVFWYRSILFCSYENKYRTKRELDCPLNPCYHYLLQ